jgi:hypothetical protein
MNLFEPQFTAAQSLLHVCCLTGAPLETADSSLCTDQALDYFAPASPHAFSTSDLHLHHDNASKPAHKQRALGLAVQVNLTICVHFVPRFATLSSEATVAQRRLTSVQATHHTNIADSRVYYSSCLPLWMSTSSWRRLPLSASN